MQTPTRKPGKYTHEKPDPYITKEKFFELEKNLEKLKHKQIFAKKEVEELARQGDFSENAAYQTAKGRLRGINQRIFDIEKYLKSAIIIKKSANNFIRLGSRATVEVNGKIKKYQILGSSETDPAKGIISHNSPIGSGLMNKKTGEVAKININNKELEYKIIKIE